MFSLTWVRFAVRQSLQKDLLFLPSALPSGRLVLLRAASLSSLWRSFFIWEHQTITNTTFFFKETLPQLWEVYFHSVSYSFADFFLQKSVTIWEWEQPKVSVRLTFAWRAWNVIFKPSLPITSIFSLWFNLHHRLWQYICNAVLRTPHCPSVHHYWIRRSTLKMFTELLYSGYRMYIISKNISSWP